MFVHIQHSFYLNIHGYKRIKETANFFTHKCEGQNIRGRRERDRDRERQRQRETGRQTDRQRQADRQTDKDIEPERERERERVVQHSTQN